MATSKEEFLRILGLVSSAQNQDEQIDDGVKDKNFPLPDLDRHFKEIAAPPLRKKNEKKSRSNKKSKIVPTPTSSRQKVTDFFENQQPKITITSSLGKKLTKTFDILTDAEKIHYHQKIEKHTKTTLNEDYFHDDPKIITKAEHIVKYDACSKYTFSHRRHNRDTEIVIGIDSSAFPLLNKCWPIAVKVGNPTDAQLRRFLLASETLCKKAKRLENANKVKVRPLLKHALKGGKSRKQTFRNKKRICDTKSGRKISFDKDCITPVVKLERGEWKTEQPRSTLKLNLDLDCVTLTVTPIVMLTDSKHLELKSLKNACLTSTTPPGRKFSNVGIEAALVVKLKTSEPIINLLKDSREKGHSCSRRALNDTTTTNIQAPLPLPYLLF